MEVVPLLLLIERVILHPAGRRPLWTDRSPAPLKRALNANSFIFSGCYLKLQPGGASSLTPCWRDREQRLLEGNQPNKQVIPLLHAADEARAQQRSALSLATNKTLISKPRMSLLL
ncbi:hypothetical protein EYF80_040320 [Liparis tanakae]|uniref:Uncharacterized protein n=1 Tax=Liparis tanakae TaxID=230148 RepID=A0A4Z2G7K7_9TELE|nr:hypothetical protein EYF80_040320 [Liparis tanakae]